MQICAQSGEEGWSTSFRFPRSLQNVRHNSFQSTLAAFPVHAAYVLNTETHKPPPKRVTGASLFGGVCTIIRTHEARAGGTVGTILHVRGDSRDGKHSTPARRCLFHAILARNCWQCVLLFTAQGSVWCVASSRTSDCPECDNTQFYFHQTVSGPAACFGAILERFGSYSQTWVDFLLPPCTPFTAIIGLRIIAIIHRFILRRSVVAVLINSK